MPLHQGFDPRRRGAQMGAQAGAIPPAVPGGMFNMASPARSPRAAPAPQGQSPLPHRPPPPLPDFDALRARGEEIKNMPGYIPLDQRTAENNPAQMQLQMQYNQANPYTPPPTGQQPPSPTLQGGVQPGLQGGVMGGIPAGGMRQRPDKMGGAMGAAQPWSPGSQRRGPLG
jgi:hypothetical protein